VVAHAETLEPEDWDNVELIPEGRMWAEFYDASRSEPGDSDGFDIVAYINRSKERTITIPSTIEEADARIRQLITEDLQFVAWVYAVAAEHPEVAGREWFRAMQRAANRIVEDIAEDDRELEAAQPDPDQEETA